MDLPLGANHVLRPRTAGPSAMLPSLSPTTLLRRKPGLVATEVETEIVLLDIEQGYYYGLNETGSRIWTLLEEPCPLQQLAETLNREYAVDTDSCINDLAPFLNELLEADLIEIAP